MAHRRHDVVTAALGVLDRYGLGDLSMRRLAADLGVQPSALYHHVASKQVLLGLVADELLRRGPARAVAADAPWTDRVAATCHGLRDACLAYRDGAEVVAAARAFGLGGHAPQDALVTALADAGLDEAAAGTAARTLLHFVLGHAVDEQTHRQAGSAGAIDDDPRAERDDFADGLAILLDGLRARVAVR